MAPAAKATARAFLADMLLILPMLGINALTPPKQDDPSDQVQAVGPESDKFDTIVVPAREEGFKQRFLNEHCWFSVRINAKHISKLKFIAAYRKLLSDFLLRTFGPSPARIQGYFTHI